MTQEKQTLEEGNEKEGGLESSEIVGAETVTPPIPETNTELKSLKHKKIKHIIMLVITLLVVGVLVCVGTYFGLKSYKSKVDDNTITIGKIKITKNDISTYLTGWENYKKENPAIILPEDLQKYAMDELILNAALKTDSEKLGITLTDKEIWKNLMPNTPDDKFVSLDSYRQTPQGKMLIIQNENKLLKVKLEDKLLLKKNLFGVMLTYDTVYFNSMPADKAEAAQTKAQENMRSKFMPVFDQKKSKEDIAKLSDVNQLNNETIDVASYEDLGKRDYTIALLYEGYRNDGKQFNDIPDTEKLLGREVGDLVDTDKKIEELKNVGDYTKLFASENGSYMILRLESKTEGTYNSWEEYIDHHKAKYAAHKLSFSSFMRSAVAVIDAQNSVRIKAASDLLAMITAYNLEHAFALICTGHSITWTYSATDQTSGAALAGAQVEGYRRAHNCPDGLTGTHTLTSPQIIGDNCNGPGITWTHKTSPAGYTQVGSTTQSGWPGANSNNNLIITEVYVRNDQPPTGSMSADCTTISWSATDPQGSPSVKIRINGTQQGGNQPAVGTMVFPSAYKDYSSKTVTASAINVGPNGPGETSIGSVSVGPCDNPPTATLSTANCSTISWTASDPQDSTPPVRVTIDGTNVFTGDGGGSTAYPLTYKGDGNSHVVRLYVTNVGPGVKNGEVTEASGSPKTVPSCDIKPTFTLSKNCNPLSMSVTITVTDPDAGANSFSAQYQIGRWNRTSWDYGFSGNWKTITVYSGVPVIISMSDTPTPPNPTINQYDLHRVDVKSTGILLNGNPGPAASLQTAEIGYDEDGAVGGTRACRHRDFTTNATANAPVLAPSDDEPTSATFQSLAGSTITDVGGYPPDRVKAVSLSRIHFIDKIFPASDQNFTPSPTPAIRTVDAIVGSGASVENYSRNPLNPTPVAGQKVCHRITITPQSGKVDTAGNIVNPPAPTGSVTPADGCTTVVAKPYIKAFNGDITAGYTTTCGGWSNGGSTGNILGYGDSLVPGKGSGVQFAAFALSNITGFRSAIGRTANPKPLKGLTFENSAATQYGAGFGAGFCAPDYFAGRPSTAPITPPVSAIALAGLAGVSEYSYSGNLVLTALGTKIMPNQKLKIFVDGDVYITDDIIYETTGGWTSASVIPSFALIVKGNIFIGKGVANLDGFYIAQPDNTGAKGEISTCGFINIGPPMSSPTFRLPTKPELYSDCNNQLAITGAINAKRIRLHRTKGSLKDSGNGEDRDSLTIAEKFIFSPESWINPTLNSGTGYSQYDSVTSTSPTL